MKHLVISIGFSLILLFNTPVFAQEKQSPEEMIQEGSRMIFQALDLILKTIPQYQAPELLGNGDIIIRRVKPHKKTPDDQTGEIKT